MIIKRNNIILGGIVLLVLSVLRIWDLLPGAVGILLLLADFGWLFLCLGPILQLLKLPASGFVRIIFLLAYVSVSLSLLYYLVGLSPVSLSVWLALSFIFIFFSGPKDKAVEIKFSQPQVECDDQASGWLGKVFIFLSLSALVVYFFVNPVVDGSPTPWPRHPWVVLAIFLVVSAWLLQRHLAGRTDRVLSWLYLFLVVGLIAMRYSLSYGYDTLIHQGSLRYILEHGQIEPLTPFYIGQYVLEILARFFSGVSFTLLERWLVPAISLLFILGGGSYLLRRLKIKGYHLMIPLSTLLLLPDVFLYTSPYALSLLWGVMAVVFLFLLASQQRLSDGRLAIVCAVAACFVHPFVGLHVLIWSVALYQLTKRKITGRRYRWLMAAIFMIAASAVILAFMAYNWLQGTGLNIYNPLYFVGNFVSIFGDPIWYIRAGQPWWLEAVYLYERIQFFLVFLAALYISIKPLDKAREQVILISASAFMSAWFFVSSFKIDNYFYGDQINYGYRLIQVSKWFLWPIILIILVSLFNRLKKKPAVYRYLLITAFSIMATVSWYLAYPRQDGISRMNVNSIRQVDYQAIDFVYNHESGKTGYVVLSNQIIGAGAILQHGFGPYYRNADGSIFYYSLPWGGPLSNIYNEIMTIETDEAASVDQEIAKLKELLKPLGIDKFYFVYTDNWSPWPDTIERLEALSAGHWSINGQVFIILVKI